MKKINEKINDLLEINNQKLKTLDEELNIINANSTDYKFTLGLLSSIIPFCISLVLCKVIITNALLPLTIAPFVSLSASFVIGFMGVGIISKTFKHKQRLKSFSNSKNEQERFEESLTKEIEYKKIKNRNRVLERLSMKDTVPIQDDRSKEEIEKENDILERKLEKRLEELDLLSSIVAIKKYESNSKDYIKRNKPLLPIVTSLLCTTMYSGLLCLNKDALYNVFNPFEQILNVSIPMLLPGTITNFFINRKHKNEQKAYHKALNQIGYNYINETPTDEYLDNSINETIDKITSNANKLIDNKLVLETRPNPQSSQEKEFSPSLIQEEVKENKQILIKTYQKK